MDGMTASGDFSYTDGYYNLSFSMAAARFGYTQETNSKTRLVKANTKKKVAIDTIGFPVLL